MNVTKTLLDLDQNVRLKLQIADDGFWLHFETMGRRSSINLPLFFATAHSISDQAIVDWCGAVVSRLRSEKSMEPASARDDDPGESETLKELISSARITELAHRLVMAGPKADHVSCSETHEIADWILDVQKRYKKEVR